MKRKLAVPAKAREALDEWPWHHLWAESDEAKLGEDVTGARSVLASLIVGVFVHLNCSL